MSKTSYISPLKIDYATRIAPELMEHFKFTSIMRVPMVEKIVLSCGVGEAIQNSKFLDSVVDELTLISGQRAVRTKARISIANFKVRKGMDIGAKVTLRKNRMYDFISRLIHIALPRVKDFRGLSPNAFDGNGNYSLGITEQIIFPEIDYDTIQKVSGFNIVINTTAPNNNEAKELLARLGIPFWK